MNKQSALEQIKQAAFEEEFEKVALKPSTYASTAIKAEEAVKKMKKILFDNVRKNKLQYKLSGRVASAKLVKAVGLPGQVRQYVKSHPRFVAGSQLAERRLAKNLLALD